MFQPTVWLISFLFKQVPPTEHTAWTYKYLHFIRVCIPATYAFQPNIVGKRRARRKDAEM